MRELNEQFGIPGVAEVVADRGGLLAVWVQGTGESQGATGMVYLHGGHVAAWKPRESDEVLWLSEKSMWEAGKPIRGGVPLCFPWFGPNKANPGLPAHGFARLQEWKLEGIEKSAAGIVVTLSLLGDEKMKQMWPGEFRLRHRVTFGRELTMGLELMNTGAKPLTAEMAQHTYFSVGDVKRVTVRGLAGVRYIDKVDGAKEKVQEGDIVITGETDRVYLETESPVTIEDAAKGRKIVVRKEHSRAAVVWNPWVAKAKAMPDFGDEEWHGMICVETCNVGAAAVTVRAGEKSVMMTRVEVTGV